MGGEALTANQGIPGFNAGDAQRVMMTRCVYFWLTPEGQKNLILLQLHYNGDIVYRHPRRACRTSQT